jgi:hypothetical protein
MSLRMNGFLLQVGSKYFICSLFNDTVSSSDYIVSNDGIMNWKGFIRKLSRLNSSTNPAFAWRDGVKPHNPSAAIAGVSTEIRTGP